MKTPLPALLGLVACFFVWTLPAAAGVSYYVALSGSDANSGRTASAAWATLQHAADTAAPGDTVTVAPGTYQQHLVVTRSGTNDTAGSGRITFTGMVGKPRPKIIAAAGYDQQSAILVNGASHIAFIALDVQATNPDGIGIGMEYYASHLYIHLCRVHDCGQSGIATFGDTGGGNGCDYVTITNNEVDHNCHTGRADGSGISFYQNQFLDGASGYHSYIMNNNIHDNIETWTNFPGYAGNTQHTDGDGIIIDVDGAYNFAQDNTLQTNSWQPAVYIAGNTLTHNGGAGIQVTKADSVWAENNKLFYNEQDPQVGRTELNVGFGHDCTFSHNAITSNAARFGTYDSVNINNLNN